MCADTHTCDTAIHLLVLVKYVATHVHVPLCVPAKNIHTWWMNWRTYMWGYIQSVDGERRLKLHRKKCFWAPLLQHAIMTQHFNSNSRWSSSLSFSSLVANHDSIPDYSFQGMIMAVMMVMMVMVIMMMMVMTKLLLFSSRWHVWKWRKH